MSERPGAGGAEDPHQLWDSGQRGRALQAALERWEQVIEAGRDLGWLEHALRASGLPVEAFALQARTARQAGASAPRNREALIESLLGSGDPWWARELLAEVGPHSRAMQALQIETELALGEEASALIVAWLDAYDDDVAVDQAVGWWVRDGRVEAAERLLEQARGSTLWRARLALWRRQPEAARRLLQPLERTPEVCALEAIAAVLEGRLAQAELQLRALLDGEQRAEAWSWLATVLRKQGRYREAIRASEAARASATLFSLVPALEYELADAYCRAGAEKGRSSAFGRLRQAIGLWARPVRKLEHATALSCLRLRGQDSVRRIDDVIDAFGGNHTPFLTTLQQGHLTSCQLPVDPRQLGASLQRVLWTRGAAAVRALFDVYLPRLAGHPLMRTYQGEIELWMGDYEAAARAFRAALAQDRRTRWAWIGLGASTMLQGDLAQAQKIWRQGLSFTSRITGVAGRSLYVYRGECYRRQGQAERARRDLTVSLQHTPQRLSALINLALLDGEPAALAQAEAACVVALPFLMQTLTGSPAENLAQALSAMRGNRSSAPSSVSYHLWGRLWRARRAQQ